MKILENLNYMDSYNAVGGAIVTFLTFFSNKELAYKFSGYTNKKDHCYYYIYQKLTIRI